MICSSASPLWNWEQAHDGFDWIFSEQFSLWSRRPPLERAVRLVLMGCTEPQYDVCGIQETALESRIPPRYSFKWGSIEWLSTTNRAGCDATFCGIPHLSLLKCAKEHMYIKSAYHIPLYWCASLQKQYCVQKMKLQFLNNVLFFITISNHANFCRSSFTSF